MLLLNDKAAISEAEAPASVIPHSEREKKRGVEILEEMLEKTLQLLQVQTST